MRINIVGNAYRKDALKAVSGAAKWIQKRGIDVALDPDTGLHLNLPTVSSAEFANADLVIAFGGDGTLIRAAHMCAEIGTPILGVYYGRFGFVTQATSENVLSCVEQFLAGQAKLESRMMLQADLNRAGQKVAEIHALNEIVLQRDVTARMMIFQVNVDGHNLTGYPADGVMVSTPTGSTGYNLSAGGPIMDPTVQALVLTALAPHTLSSRTLVLRPDSMVRLAIGSHGDAVLSADAQIRLHILSGDEVCISRSPRVTNLLVVDKDDFLIKLGRRLFWSQAILEDPN